MARLIDVEERDINYIFNKPKPYSLDVYQRDYRWRDDKDKKIVSQLLWDIELRFENNMKYNRRSKSNELEQILKDVEANFKPYFLNTIMLNEQGGNIYIVDGQQRLTTILLMLIKLYHLGIDKGEKVMNVEKNLGKMIFEEDLARKKQFKISNSDRNSVIQKIFEKDDLHESEITNITQSNLKDNYYQIISKYYEKYFFSKGYFDADRYNYYVYNLLQKVLIIEQIIKHKEDVAMIFETANDRGKDLESHEVLKGMLLGVLDETKKEKYNSIWNKALQTFYKLDGNYNNVDVFFRTYFRAKFADNSTQYKSFADKYHRTLLSNDKIINYLDRNNPDVIESFIKNDFQYYYKTFLNLNRKAKDNLNPYLAANHANDQGMQYLLILSALTINDPEEEQKINLIAKRLDQFYTISNLIGAGDNNSRMNKYYELNKVIRNKPLAQLSDTWDSIVIPYFVEHRFPLTKFNDVFQYKYFEKAKVDGRFTKYLLARVDHYLSEILSEDSFTKQESFFFIAHSGTKPVNGFHIEHIFSYNEDIMKQFKDEDGEFDEKLFIDERNRLGAVLLLKGNENLRTGNWIYKAKFKSYQQSGFIWNRILTDSINRASLNNCTASIKNKFKSYLPNEKGLLDRKAIDERQELLFEIITEIYSN